MAKPKIRHLALFARNPAKLADFYHEVFEMEIVHKSPSGACFVSDGYLTLALLPHRLEAEAAVGLNHFGFHVEDREELSRRLVAAGTEEPKKRPSNRPFAEYRAVDPEGNWFDLSEHGYSEAKAAPAVAKEMAK
ncbi:MAG: VOC family protein [Alphaproteobacteria bacterium]|nr:VOC family protein [Alphaproteobacteria bacterium]